LNIKKGYYYVSLDGDIIVKFICFSPRNNVKLEVINGGILKTINIKLEYFREDFKLLSSLEQELF
jgi:hypothetical protein